MTSSTGATLADTCPRRRSSKPLAPSSSKRRLKRRKVRSFTPNASAASCCDSRPICHPSYRSANLICLISSSTRVRFMSLLLEDHPEPDNSCATYTGQMMCYLQDGERELTRIRGCGIIQAQSRGGAVWQLVGLITRRSQVQILSPQPIKSKACSDAGLLILGPCPIRDRKS